MNRLHVSLFGKFYAQCSEQSVVGLEAAKVRELFCYLLLYPNRPHHRDKLAALLWKEHSTAQSKNYLRRTLWQLQTAFKNQEELETMLYVDADWIQLNPGNWLWLDVAIFDQAFAQTNGKQGACLEDTAVCALVKAVELYQGELLEGWYQDWCLFERDRYQQMLLLMLDKLMAHCESCGTYEAGINYGMEILRYDLVRECTHRQLMRLYYLTGDRTGALRLYERCTAVLQQELGVKPAAATEQLRAKIEADALEPPYLSSASPLGNMPSLEKTLAQLQSFDNILSQYQQQVQQEISRVKTALYR